MENINRSSFFTSLYSTLFRCDPCMGLFRNTSTIKEQNNFRKLCRDFVGSHHYAPILWFVHDVFSQRANMDLKLLGTLLSKVSVDEQSSLADLCNSYLLYIHEDATGTSLPQGIDLFANCPEKLALQTGKKPRLTVLMPKFLLHHVYGIPSQELTFEVVDHMVDMVRQQAVSAYEEHCEKIRANNHIYAQTSCVERFVPDIFTDSHRDAAIPGMLLPFLMAAEYQSDMELCYYILENYVLPTLSRFPWEQRTHPLIHIYAQDMRYYADYIHSILQQDLPLINDVYSKNDLTYYGQDFYYEALGKGNPARYRYADEQVVSHSKAHEALFLPLTSILQRATDFLKQTLHPNTYAFCMLIAPYMLFLSGHETEAQGFLLQNFSALNGYEKRKPHIVILLVRSILQATHLETANALYGLFSYEIDMPKREQQEFHHFCRQMLRFLEDVKNYYHQTNLFSYADNRTWFDVLFADGAMDRLLAECSQKLDAEQDPSHDSARALSIYVEAFCHDAFVRTNLLGLHYKDEQLPDELPDDLRLQGQACLLRTEFIKLYYTRLAQADSLKDIGLHLQNHLFRLQKEQVTTTLQRVKVLKKSLPQTSAEEESLLEDIAQISQDLMQFLQGDRTLRPEVERELAACRIAFEEKYFHGEVNLMRKLPEELRSNVHNYLVTSNMVFHMLADQCDDHMDFSAALISMVRALELVMGYIYSRMDIHMYEGITKDSLLHYFENGLPITKPTMRPCVELLTGMKRFQEWGGLRGAGHCSPWTIQRYPHLLGHK